jgi:hypothetical protein
VDALAVTGSTDSQSYPAGKNPLLTLKVTNSSKAACSVNVGTNQMEFQIFRGNERVFSSRDCQEGGEDLVRTLAPGASETANFRWLRNRTAPGCSPVSDVPPPGSYSYQVSLGQSTSNKTTFGLE